MSKFSKLPFDDEQAILDSLSVEPTQEVASLDNEDNEKPEEATKYFTNDKSSQRPEGDLSKLGQLVGQKHSMRDPFQPPQGLDEKEMMSEPQEDNKLKQVEQLLSSYKKMSPLSDIQKDVADTNRNLALSLAGNQIAQAIASGYGAKIGDGSEAINMLSKQNQQKISDYKDRIKDRADDPNSDISKTYRLVVAQSLKKKYPDLDLSQLDSMSANELEGLAKSQMNPSANRTPQQTDYETIDGQPLSFDPMTGKYKNIITGQDYAGQVRRKITTQWTNPETGLTYQKDSLGNIIQQIKAPNNQQPNTISNSTISANQEIKEQSPQISKEQQEALRSPTSLKKVNPKLYEQFKKDQEKFVTDMKDRREVADSTVNLTEKLKDGDLTDSGLLGGIQTQAARMAGQKGVLTDQDLVKFGGAGGFDAAISRFMNAQVAGKMSSKDVKFFKEFSAKMADALNQNIKNASQIYTKNIYNEAKDYLPGLTEDMVRDNWLNMESVAPAVQGKKKDSQVEKYATDHNLNYDKARGILIKRGYKPNE